MILLGIMSILSIIGSVFIVSSYLRFHQSLNRIDTLLLLVAHMATANGLMQFCLLWHSFSSNLTINQVSYYGKILRLYRNDTLPLNVDVSSPIYGSTMSGGGATNATMASMEDVQSLMMELVPLCSTSNTFLHYFSTCYVLFNCIVSWALYKKISRSWREKRKTSSKLWHTILMGWGLPLLFVSIPKIFAHKFGSRAWMESNLGVDDYFMEEVVVQHSCDATWAAAVVSSGSSSMLNGQSALWRMEGFLFLPSFLAVAFNMYILVRAKVVLSHSKRMMLMNESMARAATQQFQYPSQQRSQPSPSRSAASSSAGLFSPVDDDDDEEELFNNFQSPVKTMQEQQLHNPFSPPLHDINVNDSPPSTHRSSIAMWPFSKLRMRQHEGENSPTVTSPGTQISMKYFSGANEVNSIGMEMEHSGSDIGSPSSFQKTLVSSPGNNMQYQQQQHPTQNTIMSFPGMTSFGTFITPESSTFQRPARSFLSRGQSPNRSSGEENFKPHLHTSEQIKQDNTLMNTYALYPAVFVLSWMIGGTLALFNTVLGSKTNLAVVSLFHIANLGMASTGFFHALVLLKTQPCIVSKWRHYGSKKEHYEDLFQDEREGALFEKEEKWWRDETLQEKEWVNQRGAYF